MHTHPHPHDTHHPYEHDETTGPPWRLRWAVARRLRHQQWQAGWVPADDETGPGRGDPRGGGPGRGGAPRGGGPRGGSPRGGPFGGPRGGHPFGHHGPAGGPPFGPGGWMGPRRGGRARRGDVRAAVLALLAEQPRNGYQLITEIEQRSGGVWKPSPGSVYPVLAQLEDEELIGSTTETGRKAFAITEAGRAEVEARGGAAPWDAARDDMGEGTFELMGGLKQVGGALWQIAGSGTAAQQREAAEILAETRSRLYRLLADGPTGATPDATPDAPTG